MKSYVCDNQIRLVGKAWEIKHSLHTIVEQAGGTSRLLDYLSELKVKIPTTMPSKAQKPHLHLVK
jgi:hypothetical protein